MLTLLFLILNIMGYCQNHDSGKVSSTFADYDGSILTLKGKVQLEHPIGTMQSEEAFLEKEEDTKEFPFSLIHLNQNILLTLKNNAHLKGDKADLDFHTLKGTISSGKGKTVEYADLNLQLTSKSIAFEMVKKGAIFSITELCAYPHVDQKCVITKEQDRVEADLITADITTSTLLLDHPQGVVSHILFSSNKMVWNNNANTLTLEEEVDLKEENAGSLKADRAFIQCTEQKPILFTFNGNIRLCSTNGKKRFAIGDTLIYFPTEKNFHIKADPGKKVLFFDEEQSLYISANEIKINNMDNVRGVGNVRLSFNPEESTVFKSFFPEFQEERNETP